jgi:hypothetical protein
MHQIIDDYLKRPTIANHMVSREKKVMLLFSSLQEVCTKERNVKIKRNTHFLATASANASSNSTSSGN